MLNGLEIMPLRIFLDIETIPPDDEVKVHLKPCIIEKILRSHKSITKSQKSDSNDDSDDINKSGQATYSDELFRTLALHAEIGRILCIGVILEKDGMEWRKGIFGYDTKSEVFHLDEKKSLRGFWKLLKKEFNPRSDLIVGHNIMDFDLPFIYKRSRILKVKPSFQFSFARYRSHPIYDTMREWALWNLRECTISLSLLAELLRIDLIKTEGIDGSRVYDEFLAGNHSLIAEYCLQDVEVTRAVYHQMVLTDDHCPG